MKMSESEIYNLANLAYQSVEQRHNIAVEAAKLGSYIKGCQHDLH